MINVVNLDTGISVVSVKGNDGKVRIKVLDKNETYKFNVWWSKTKDSLSSMRIKII
tara:strand:+ start:1405 stop:1572 length:168 start_codon:yes stop_codon:yes gene_type:complete